jgi:Lrp/AsnC family leucine-responsive transcriptional regulator
MVKLDLKDRKILYELDLNCRQSNAQIGKKVGLKRDVVAYRIKKMQDEGIIKNFWAGIDTFKLGYNVFRVYINFQYMKSDIKEEIIQYFVDYKNSWAVISAKTEIDLAVIVWVKDIFEFYQFWEKTLDKYEDYFAKYAISIYIQGDVYKKSYLLPEINDKSDRKLYTVRCGGEPIKIDEMDHKLLNELAENARIPLIDLAEKLGCSSQSINYRIKNLLKSGVIYSFRVDIDLSKLGYQRYKPNIYLKDHRLKLQIYNYLKDKPYLEYMNLAIGWADLGPEIVVKDYDELLKIMDEINTKFSGGIKKQFIFITNKVHKLRCMPELKF